jgi:hypothetical protein
MGFASRRRWFVEEFGPRFLGDDGVNDLLVYAYTGLAKGR